VLDHPEASVSLEMADISGIACDQVVNRKNVPAAIEEVIAQMRPEKSRTPRDYCAQWENLSKRKVCEYLSFFMARNPLARPFSRTSFQAQIIVASAVSNTKARNCTISPVQAMTSAGCG
jgi:hypothetical protein